MATFYYTRVSSNGGMIWINSPTVNLKFIENVLLEYVYAQNGAMVYLGTSTSSVNLISTDATYLRQDANSRGSFMFLEGDSTPAITFVLTTSQWYCNWSG